MTGDGVATPISAATHRSGRAAVAEFARRNHSVDSSRPTPAASLKVSESANAMAQAWSAWQQDELVERFHAGAFEKELARADIAREKQEQLARQLANLEAELGAMERAAIDTRATLDAVLDRIADPAHSRNSARDHQTTLCPVALGPIRRSSRGGGHGDGGGPRCPLHQPVERWPRDHDTTNPDSARLDDSPTASRIGSLSRGVPTATDRQVPTSRTSGVRGSLP